MQLADPAPPALAAFHVTLPSPLGALTVGERDGRIVSVGWSDGAPDPSRDAATPLLRAAAQQLHAYFHDGLRRFDLPLAPAGSAFEHAVWDRMLSIPYGETRSYGEIARAIGASVSEPGRRSSRRPARGGASRRNRRRT